MNSGTVARSFGTHDGSFHADEVTACAFLLHFNLIDEDKIYRTREKEILDKCEYVCDVGGIYDPALKCFDHHQADYQGDLSSAGMILLYLKEEGILSEKEFSMFRNVMVAGVDAHDNGKDPQIPGYCTYSHIIANFRPIPYDPPPEEENQAFREALRFAGRHLSKVWERYYYTQSCKEVVHAKMQDSTEALIFEKGIPWLEPFFELGGESHPAKFVIMPSGGSWNLRAIPPTYADKMDVRCPLPSEWAGLLEDDLKKASGIEGAIFCHKGRFISVWETREDAIRALNYTLEQQKEPS